MGEPVAANDLGIAEWLRDDVNWIELRRSPRVCDFFNRNAIMFDHSDLLPAEHWPLRIGKAGAIEQYSMRSGVNAGAMGAFSYLYSALDFPGLGVGRYCSIGSGLVIFGERHPLEWVTTSNITYCPSPLFVRAQRDLMGGRPLLPPPSDGAYPVIAHDVWVAQNVSIARDVTIGTGAVLAMGAVVTRSVEPYMIVGGNPARPIRRRFDDATCERLLASAWWEAHPDALFRLDRADPNRFLDQLEAARATGEIGAAPIRAFTWRQMLEEIAAAPE